MTEPTPVPGDGPAAPGDGLAAVPRAEIPLARRDFVSDQEVRWCPGCGDFAILAAFQGLLPELGIRRENTVVVSGIGCSSRLPYYVDCYGMHSIHGRAPAIATGIATTREDLAVFVVTGDGDGLSIGGNHLIHALRRNVNMTILLFNNRIYGLTKGQFSPTSELGKVTKSSPLGAPDAPFNPVSLALGAEASFVARAVDSDRHFLTEVLRAAATHRGASFVEIYQNCSIFNDGAWEGLRGPGTGLIHLEHGRPVTFGDHGARCVVRTEAGLAVAETAAVDPASILVHDAHAADPTAAFALSRLTDMGQVTQAPVGIFRDVHRPCYDDEVRAQGRLAAQGITDADAALAEVLAGGDSWQVP